MATPDVVQGTLTWFDTILFVGVPAIFGGILQISYKLTYGSLFGEEQRGTAGSESPKTRGVVLKDLITGALFGLGGAAAVVLAAIWLKKFDMTATSENKLYLIVLGVVAGFVGYRILPRVARESEHG